MLSNQTGPIGNTSEYVASLLRREIFKGVYQVNQPLPQDSIAKKLKVSKIPLREALVQLKSEGLVNFLPNRGAIVSELTPAEIEEIFSMRYSLESLAIEKAVPHFSKADFIRAQSTLEIIDGEKEETVLSDLNWEFHEILYQPSNMSRLLQTVQILNYNIARYIVLYLDRLSGSNVSQMEHKAMLKAFKEKNTEKAQAVLRQHLKNAQSSLLAFLE